VPRIDVVVLGDVNPDLVLRGAAAGAATGQRELLVEEATLTVGGSGAIFACGATRLGLRTTLIGAVAPDPFGRFMESELVARGVDTSELVWRKETSTGISVIVSSSTDRGIYTAPGAIAVLGIDDVDSVRVTAARHVHVAAYFLQRGLQPGLASLLATARRRGLVTSLDPNWDPAERWEDGLAELLGYVDVFFPNEAEATRIARVDDVEVAARRLAERAGLVVVKLGGRGALAVHGDAPAVRVGPIAGIEIVDTTGAGDAFDAGFVYATLQGWKLERALAFANACGALSCRAGGGVDAQPTLDEALALMPGDDPTPPR
jgi:sugar/nucleoside kinase (ribokinase family)